MAKPIYIICSESGAEDRISGRVSLFNLVEKIQIGKLPPDFKGIVISKGISLWVTAAWMRESEEEGTGEFDFETIVNMPGSAEPIEMMKGSFAFGKVFQRIMTRIEGHLPFSGSGTMTIQCRIRRAGSTVWSAQECPIILEEMALPIPPTEPTSPIDSRASSN